MLRRLADSFIPLEIRNSSEDIRTERIFVTVLLISAISNLMGISIAYQIGADSISYLLFTNAAINFLLLFLYKKGLSRIIASHVFIAQHAVSFCFQAWIQGGLISPAIAAFFLLPAVAMLILGNKGAIFWFFVSALVLTGYFIYESNYGPPLIKYDISQREYLFFSSILGTNLTIFIILLVYENSKNRAIMEIRRKHADLKAAQSILIQTEKMASLGELTAGIAHEIQNPLNFVNNFSDVNSELIEELREEAKKGNFKEVDALANNIEENENKILHHGQRADAIVKSMLLHSRGSEGKKVPTDINALADEYLRLAYHGLRAKDKSFNADFKLELDESLPKINVVPQDIGRVLLNLINNAFYAVSQKSEARSENYKPTVTVSTKSMSPSGGGKGEEKIQIKVSDNGNGIPDDIKDKIFQPFFTTKPTGEGTGLGLSMSYDIIIKGHGGTMEVESEKGEGTEFKISLPV